MSPFALAHTKQLSNLSTREPKVLQDGAVSMTWAPNMDFKNAEMGLSIDQVGQFGYLIPAGSITLQRLKILSDRTLFKSRRRLAAPHIGLQTWVQDLFEMRDEVTIWRKTYTTSCLLTWQMPSFSICTSNCYSPAVSPRPYCSLVPALFPATGNLGLHNYASHSTSESIAWHSTALYLLWITLNFVGNRFGTAGPEKTPSEKAHW